MIDLALALDCWPPQLFSRPLHHLLNELSPVVSYPVMDSDNAIELLGDLRQRLLHWQQQIKEERAGTLRELFMAGNFEKAADHFLSEIDQDGSSDEDRDIAAWSLTISANQLLKKARRIDSKKAKILLKEASEKYDQALNIKADLHAALSNWGNCLMQQARLSISPTEATSLFVLAESKYMKALTIKPKRLETLNNLGNLFYERASRAVGDHAIGLFKQAAKMYKSALKIKPDQQETLSNFGCLLMELSKSTRGKQRNRLLAEARAKLVASRTINPAKTYNLACLAGLQGDEAECQLNLENSEQQGTLPAVEHLRTNPDLDFIRDKLWFKQLVEREASRSI
jgi:tetratricopeptide (TPR) repeat protein